jgi:putative ABC transport system ATP-binding protein
LPEVPGLFSLSGVELTVDDHTILHDVDLEVPDGGITMIVGPSGSGKSTLLRLLNGLERPTGGTIEFRGESLDSIDVRALRRRVGMVFQRPTVFDGSSFDNLKVAEPELDRSGAVAAMTRVGLSPDLLDRDARKLSGGEAQRLCLARTLLTRPGVVLMDEPTSALDDESVHLIEHLAGEVAADGVSVLWVSHDRSQVRRMANHIVSIEQGTVVDSGPATAMGHVHEDDEVWSTRDDATPVDGAGGRPASDTVTGDRPT